MNLQKNNLKFTFIAALIPTLLFPALFPAFRIQFMIPFLITLYYQRSYIDCLWGSLLCGLIMDLLSQNHRLGLYGMIFCMTTMILYRQRRNFFADTVTTLPIMTFFFSVTSTIIHGLLISTFDSKLNLSAAWFFTDLILYPLFDALYAFVFFVLPYWIFGKSRRNCMY